jgi:hypothetical protein
MTRFFLTFVTRKMPTIMFQTKVITAVYDVEAQFPNPNFVRCHEVQLPWRVNNAACYRINLYRSQWSTSPPSLMNDPGLKGTADSIWGAQCGNTTGSVKALTAIKLSTRDFYLENIQCCPLYNTALSTGLAANPATAGGTAV